jgi:hypothetical protein
MRVASGFAMLLALSAPLIATADIVVAPEDRATPGLSGWLQDQSWMSVGNPGLNAGGASAASALTAQRSEAGEWSRSASRLFAETVTPGLWIDFDYWDDTMIPDYVQMRWAGNDLRLWQRAARNRAGAAFPIQEWTLTESALFEDYQDWDYGGGSQQRFLDDLASVNWIGVLAAPRGPSGPFYGIDDFTVPEPGQWWMLGLALVSGAAGLWFRRRSTPRV